jgi:hypothetical protein
MTVITIGQNTSESLFVGLLSFARAAELSASEIDLPHPDNVNAWELMSVEVVSSVCATLEVRMTPQVISNVAPAFYTMRIRNPKHMTAFLNALGALDFSLVTPEDDFPEYRASDVKRAITKCKTSVENIVNAGGGLILMYSMYLTGCDTVEELLVAYVEAILDDEDDVMLRLDKQAPLAKQLAVQQRTWEKGLAKFTKKMDFVEREILD